MISDPNCYRADSDGICLLCNPSYALEGTLCVQKFPNLGINSNKIEFSHKSKLPSIAEYVTLFSLNDFKSISYNTACLCAEIDIFLWVMSSILRMFWM
jgi:hypothetical protein